MNGSAGQQNGVSGSGNSAAGAVGVSGSGAGGAAGVAGSAGASGTGAGGRGTAGSGGSTAGGASGSSAGGASGGNGGAAGSAGTAGMNGSGGAAGSQSGTPPGDIASAAGTPLVAAHSVTRALYAAYNGKLFQARRASDGKTQDINTTGAGGFVDLTALNTFCTGTTCTVAKLYDQAGNGNDMSQAAVASQPTVGFWTAANSTKYPMVVSAGYQWLRNRTSVKNIPKGSNPQTEYFVVHGDNAGRATGTNGCCYDYGNMEAPNIGDDGPGTMSALYFGDATDWTRGAGAGPWVMLDMENGVFAGGGPIAILNAGNSSVNANDPSLKYPSPNIVVGLAKTDGKTTFEIKYGNASTGMLSVAWNGSLPTHTNPTSYIPLQQEGGISLGEGGDGSAMGTGAFSEGVIIAAETSDATDNAIQANLTTIYK
jgi:non-reducing end alpha-L-arabinofuranosidase